MFAKLSFFWFLLLIATGRYNEDPAPVWSAYDVWTESGIHLMMTDHGTPDDPFDDFVIDYENNRQVKVTILDN